MDKLSLRLPVRGFFLSATAGSLLLLAACKGDSLASPPPISSVPAISSGVLPLASAISINDGHAVGARHWGDGDWPNGGQGQSVDGLTCAVQNETYHVHSHLSILLDGHALMIPSDIGIVATSPTAHCTYAIHTHDLSGKIHVEAPVAGTFTLGQFFDIWGQPLSREGIAEFRSLPITVFITDDGVVSEYLGDLASIELKSHREITIQIGDAVTQIPNYTWSGP